MLYFDVIIIGSGVVGLALARKFSKNNKACLVIEKNAKHGMETSSRNSGVIHAGMYYPENSLKAKLCILGNPLLYEYCQQKNIAYNKIGKYIVATDQIGIVALEQIQKQGIINGVNGLQLINKQKFQAIEPHIKCEVALHSPQTGIVDVHELMQALEVDALNSDCTFAYNHDLESIQKLNNGYCLQVTHMGTTQKVSAPIVINSAGLDSDTVARLLGLDLELLEYQLSYSRGHYFSTSTHISKLVNHLIYPIPDKHLTGLGIHITLDLHGRLRLGPDSEFLSNRDKTYPVSIELLEKFQKAVSKYFPVITLSDLKPDFAGIRPKLQTIDGEFRDFIIQEETKHGFPGWVNLIGIESPGLTCSLAIADFVYKMTCH